MRKALYKITNLVNGKAYIGQSIDPYKRFISHCSRSSRDSDNSPIHAAIKKYGKENFSIEILEWSENYNQREKELIQEHGSLAPNGYNVALGGEDPPHKYGEAHHKSVISEKDMDTVVYLLKNSELTEPQICAYFNKRYSQSLINNINWGITHRREGITYPIRTQCPYNLTTEEVDSIKWLLRNSSYPCYQIAEHYQVSTSAIKHINSGRNYFVETTKYPIRKHRGKKQSQPVEAILAKRSTNAIDTHLETGVCTNVHKK